MLQDGDGPREPGSRQREVRIAKSATPPRRRSVPGSSTDQPTSVVGAGREGYEWGNAVEQKVGGSGSIKLAGDMSVLRHRWGQVAHPSRMASTSSSGERSVASTR